MADRNDRSPTTGSRHSVASTSSSRSRDTTATPATSLPSSSGSPRTAPQMGSGTLILTPRSETGSRPPIAAVETRPWRKVEEALSRLLSSHVASLLEERYDGDYSTPKGIAVVGVPRRDDSDAIRNAIALHEDHLRPLADEDATNALLRLRAVVIPTETVEESELRLQLYLEELRNHPADCVLAGCSEAALFCRFFPPLSELLAYIAPLSRRRRLRHTALLRLQESVAKLETPEAIAEREAKAKAAEVSRDQVLAEADAWLQQARAHTGIAKTRIREAETGLPDVQHGGHCADCGWPLFMDPGDSRQLVCQNRNCIACPAAGGERDV